MTRTKREVLCEAQGITKDEALEQLRRLAGHVSESDPEDANLRFLEHIARAEDPTLLRDALVAFGARRVLEDARAAHRPSRVRVRCPDCDHYTWRDDGGANPRCLGCRHVSAGGGLQKSRAAR